MSSFLLLALSALTQSAPAAGVPEPPPAERASLAENYVAQKLVLWQRHLRLENWTMSIRMCPPPELKPRALGNIHWDTRKRTAVIRILDSRHYKLPYQEMLDDMEFTVVHELLHLRLSSLPRGQASRDAGEEAVNRIAEALLRLDRR